MQREAVSSDSFHVFMISWSMGQLARRASSGRLANSLLFSLQGWSFSIETSRERHTRDPRMPDFRAHQGGVLEANSKTVPVARASNFYKGTERCTLAGVQPWLAATVPPKISARGHANFNVALMLPRFWDGCFTQLLVTLVPRSCSRPALRFFRFWDLPASVAMFVRSARDRDFGAG